MKEKESLLGKSIWSGELKNQGSIVKGVLNGDWPSLQNIKELVLAFNEAKGKLRHKTKLCLEVKISKDKARGKPWVLREKEREWTVTPQEEEEEEAVSPPCIFLCLWSSSYILEA